MRTKGLPRVNVSRTADGDTRSSPLWCHPSTFTTAVTGPLRSITAFVSGSVYDRTTSSARARADTLDTSGPATMAPSR